MKKERNSKLGYAKNGWLYKEKTAGYIFSAPFIFGFLFFVIVPVATSLYYAFCNYNILKPARWVGLKNFIDIFQDPTFYKALGVTLKFAFISVPLKLVFALIVALILEAFLKRYIPMPSERLNREEEGEESQGDKTQSFEGESGKS